MINRREEYLEILTKIDEFRNRFILSREELLEIVTKLVCPPPCVGYINETGWHQLCVDKATAAMKVINRENAIQEIMDLL